MYETCSSCYVAVISVDYDLHVMLRQTNKNKTGKQTDRQTGRTDRPDRQTDRQADRQAVRQADINYTLPSVLFFILRQKENRKKKFVFTNPHTFKVCFHSMCILTCDHKTINPPDCMSHVYYSIDIYNTLCLQKNTICTLLR